MYVQTIDLALSDAVKSHPSALSIYLNPDSSALLPSEGLQLELAEDRADHPVARIRRRSVSRVIYPIRRELNAHGSDEFE